MLKTFTTNSAQALTPLRGKVGRGALQFVSGTGTITIEGSLDGTTYYPLALKVAVTDAIVASATAAGLWNFDTGVFDYLQVRCASISVSCVVRVSIGEF